MDITNQKYKKIILALIDFYELTQGIKNDQHGEAKKTIALIMAANDISKLFEDQKTLLREFATHLTGEHGAHYFEDAIIDEFLKNEYKNT